MQTTTIINHQESLLDHFFRGRRDACRDVMMKNAHHRHQHHQQPKANQVVIEFRSSLTIINTLDDKSINNLLLDLVINNEQ